MSLKRCNGTGCHSSIAEKWDFDNFTNGTEPPLSFEEIFYSVVHDQQNKLSIFSRIIEVLLSTFGVVFNGFFIVVIMSTPSLAEIKTTAFIMSLSVSDLFVSGIVMVFSILIRLMPEITDDDDSNKAACWLWASVSMAACTASSLNVCAISVDRYLSITFPLHYENVITRCRINVVILSIWAISLFMAFLTLYLGFGDERLDRYPIEMNLPINDTAAATANKTLVDFINYCQDLPGRAYIVAIVSLIVLLPCLVVICVYFEIFRLVNRQIEMIKKNKACARRLTQIPHIRSKLSLLALHSSIISSYDTNSPVTTLRDSSLTPPNSLQKSPKRGKLYLKKSSCGSRPQSLSITETTENVEQPEQHPSTSSSQHSAFIHVYPTNDQKCQYVVTDNDKIYFVRRSINDDDTETTDAIYTNQKEAYSNEKQGRPSVSSQYMLSLVKLQAKGATNRQSVVSAIFTNISRRMSANKTPEVKAAAILMVIAGTYVVCWLPFGIVSIIQAYHPDTVSWALREAFLWLAYSNSCWNPLIYALLNKTFRLSIYLFLVKNGCKRCLIWSDCRVKRKSVSEASQT